MEIDRCTNMYVHEVKKKCAYITHKQPAANTSLQKVRKTSNIYLPFPLSYSSAIPSVSNLAIGPKPVPLLAI